MITRRTVVAAGAAALAASGSRDAEAKASQPSTKVSFKVPSGACDCHTHIVLDPAKVPLFEGRMYTPETASPEEMTALHKALGIERVVIVTPSFYGTDNKPTLVGMRARGRNARGVAVIGDKTPAFELTSLKTSGFTGIRINLTTAGTNDPKLAAEQLKTAIDRVKKLGWHIQIYTNLSVISAIKEQVMSSPIPIVFDHFGGAKAALGVDQPGFADLLDLVKAGKAYVKISGAYLASDKSPDYADVAPLAKALIGANQRRVVWGTNWPHPNSAPLPGKPKTEVTPLFQRDDGALLNLLAGWAPDAKVRHRILVDNPAELYGF